MDEKKIIKLIDEDKINLISYTDLSKYNDILHDMFMNSKIGTIETAKVVTRINKINKYLNSLEQKNIN
jgi:hypothetical protein